MLPPSWGRGEVILRPPFDPGVSEGELVNLNDSTLNCTLNLKTPSFLFISLICHLSIRLLQPCGVFLSCMCIFEGHNRALKRKRKKKTQQNHPSFISVKPGNFTCIFLCHCSKKHCFFLLHLFLFSKQHTVVCAHVVSPELSVHRRRVGPLLRSLIYSLPTLASLFPRLLTDLSSLF